MSADKLAEARQAAETSLTDYYMRLAINLKGEKQREQRMREARNSAVPGTDI